MITRANNTPEVQNPSETQLLKRNLKMAAIHSAEKAHLKQLLERSIVWALSPRGG